VLLPQPGKALSPSSSNHVGIIAGVVVGVFAIAGTVAVVVVIRRRVKGGHSWAPTAASEHAAEHAAEKKSKSTGTFQPTVTSAAVDAVTAADGAGEDGEAAQHKERGLKKKKSGREVEGAPQALGAQEASKKKKKKQRQQGLPAHTMWSSVPETKGSLASWKESAV
jgi:predicted molibdopterin-dependent oxidoreductase YjgC